MSNLNVERFIEPSNKMYDIALNEIKKGEKQNHWMWYIFPQLKGLGRTSTSDFYGIENLDEAILFLEHPVLGKRLIEITKCLLEINTKSAFDIFGSPDYLKLNSCMTLFNNTSKNHTIFQQVIDKYYSGIDDNLTIIKLKV